MGPTKDSMGAGIAGELLTDSCRLDWLSVSYFAATNSIQRRQISYFLELLNLLSGTYEMDPGGGRRFFEESWQHGCGIGLKWTEPEGSGVNKGLLSVDIRGQALAAFPSHIRKSVYMDMAEIEGYKQCTRMDMQRTLLNPVADAQEIYRRLTNREVWIKGFNGWHPGHRIDIDGNPLQGCTVEWGSKKGTTNCKTYDKRAQQCVEGPPTVRHELLHRKQPARDRFNSLYEGLKAEGEGDDTSYEQFFVQSNLAQTMTYLDTSRLKDIPRSEWPANWARDSKPADFWDQVVTGDVEEFQTQWRYERTLERLIKNRAKQYGRGRSKFVLLRIFRDGESLQNVQQDDLDLDFIRLKDEDIEEVLAQIPEDRRDEARSWALHARRVAAKNVEDAHNL